MREAKLEELSNIISESRGVPSRWMSAANEWAGKLRIYHWLKRSGNFCVEWAGSGKVKKRESNVSSRWKKEQFLISTMPRPIYENSKTCPFMQRNLK